MKEVRCMCEHKWIFQESSFSHRFTTTYNDLYERIDTYYCEKCLGQKEVIAKHEYARCRPYWYKK